MTGQLRAQFDQDSKIDLLDFATQNHSEYLPLTRIKTLLSPYSSPETQSPKQNKSSKQKQARPQPSINIPKSRVNSFGVTDAVQTFLEVSLRVLSK